jgi:hypothetical protein
MYKNSFNCFLDSDTEDQKDQEDTEDTEDQEDKEDKEDHIQENKITIDNGNTYLFDYVWTVWSHNLNSQDWTITGFNKIWEIKSISDFWLFVNIISKLNFKNNRFFVMRDNIQPLWEDENNRNGGSCSIRIQAQLSFILLEKILLSIMNESFIDNKLDINGISFCSKNQWSIVKIWNKDKNNDISTQINPSILSTFNEKDICIRYKSNIPEY